MAGTDRGETAGLVANRGPRAGGAGDGGLNEALQWAAGVARENFMQNPAIAKLVADERRQVAEQIASAIEGQWEKIWLSKEEPPYWADYERAVYRTLKTAAEIARGEGSE